MTYRWAKFGATARLYPDQARERLRELMIDQGFTYLRTAETLDISPRTLHRIVDDLGMRDEIAQAREGRN